MVKVLVAHTANGPVLGPWMALPLHLMGSRNLANSAEKRFIAATALAKKALAVRRLELSGVGYRIAKDTQAYPSGTAAPLAGQPDLLLYIGRATPIRVQVPHCITNVEIKKGGVEVEISGVWEEDVAQFASAIKSHKPASKDHYKQKGIEVFAS